MKQEEPGTINAFGEFRRPWPLKSSSQKWIQADLDLATQNDALFGLLADLFCLSFSECEIWHHLASGSMPCIQRSSTSINR